MARERFGDAAASPYDLRNASGPVDQRGALIVGATYVTLQ